jgi:protein phosphatase 1G
MQGWRKRMEDSHIADLDLGSNKSIHVFGVFDGHGGKEVAQLVKKYFSNELIKNNSFKDGNMKKALIENFLRMDTLMQESTGKLELKKIAKLSKEEDEEQNKKEKNKQADLFKQMFDPKTQDDFDVANMTGCTASVFLIDEENKKIYFANAGDSRAVLCKNRKAYPMTIDHKPDMDGEKSRIYKADGWVSEGRVKGI